MVGGQATHVTSARAQALTLESPIKKGDADLHEDLSSPLPVTELLCLARLIQIPEPSPSPSSALQVKLESAIPAR